MIDMRTQFIGKKIIIYLHDGVNKFGLCKGIDDHYILLQYDNGRTEMISHSNVKNFKEDLKR